MEPEIEIYKRGFKEGREFGRMEAAKLAQFFKDEDIGIDMLETDNKIRDLILKELNDYDRGIKATNHH